MPPKEKSVPKASSSKEGFVALDVKRRATRALAACCKVMGSVVQYDLVWSKVALSKSWLSPKNAS